MNVMAMRPQKTTEIDDLKSRLKNTWMTGDYDLFSRYMEDGARKFFQHLHIPSRSRVLDVACGAGQVALIAARAGANVTGCDIATNWIEKARTRAAHEGLNVEFDEGDAEALPYPDAQFDAVVSLVGAMFAPHPDRVAAELIRVCRPGGKIAMGNWTSAGFIGQMLKTIGKFIAPPGMPSPLLWGDQETVRERLREGTGSLMLIPRMYRFEYPFGPAAVVDFFRQNYGPMSRAFGSLPPEAQQQLHRELVAVWSAHNQDTGNGTIVDSEYLEVTAIRA